MAITLRDKRETYYFRETLSSVLRGLIDNYTVIDLRNESAVYGRIKEVTAFMDVELDRCVFKNPRGDFFPFETFYVKSRNIRYVHIPDGCTAQQLIEKGMHVNKPLGKRPPHTGKKPVYKLKRAQNYQNQILKELHSQK